MFTLQYRRFAPLVSFLKSNYTASAHRALSTAPVTFEGLGIKNREVLDRLSKLGYTAPSEIQAKAIGTILDGRDALLCAETGSGKTLTYLLPMLDMLLDTNFADTISAIAPSLSSLTRMACGKVGPIKNDTYDVLLATPVAFQDNVNPSHLEQLSHVVLDEADILLTGSSSTPILTNLFPRLKLNRNVHPQVIFAAATMPGNGKKSVRSFVRKYFPHCVEINTTGAHRPPPTLHQAFIQADDVDLPTALSEGDEYLARRDNVKRALERSWLAAESYEEAVSAAAEADNKWRQRCVIDALASSSCSDVGSAEDRQLVTPKVTVTRRNPNRGSFNTSLTPEEVARCNTRSTLIFVSSVDQAVQLVDFLKAAAPSLKIAGLHKKLSPEDRDKIFQKFQNGHIKILVSTDVAARGLDTIDVEHVIQYHVATDASSYLHRIGRTARMGRYGRVTTLVGPDSERLVADILAAAAEDRDLEGVFSRKRSLRRNQKKRVEKVEADAIERLNPDRHIRDEGEDDKECK